MKRALLGWLTSCALASLAWSKTSDPMPRNVVVIVMDDVGTELIGAYDAWFAARGRPSGYPAATGAIDQMLARQGVMFTQAWSSPNCSPTRAALLTGRYGMRNGVGTVTATRPVVGKNGIDNSVELLPQVLHGAATRYDCFAVGKWHLADRAQFDVNPAHPLGFPHGTWFDRWVGSYFAVGNPGGGLPATIWGYSVWKKSFASPISAGDDPCAPLPLVCQYSIATPPIQNYATVNTTEDALTMLSEAREPFLLYVAYNAIHKPLHDVPAGLPQPQCPEFVAPTLPCANNGVLPDDPARGRCMLEALDAQIGRLLCAIDHSSTTVILLGDNATSFDVSFAPYLPSHAKGTVYNGGIHVPMIVRSPIVPPELVGTVVEAPVHAVDVFATVCEFAGVDPNSTRGVDSLSLVPYLLGPAAPLREFNYAEAFEPNFYPDPLTGGPPAGYVGKLHSQALSDGRFKLIRSWRKSTSGPPILKEELFDFEAGLAGQPDWFEAHNLLLDESLSSAAVVALERLRAELDLNYPRLVP